MRYRAKSLIQYLQKAIACVQNLHNYATMVHVSRTPVSTNYDNEMLWITDVMQTYGFKNWDSILREVLESQWSLWLLSLQWRNNDHDGVSNHQPHGCLPKRLYMRWLKKTSTLRVTGLCEWNSPRPVNSPHKGPVTRKMFPFDDVIMWWTTETMWWRSCRIEEYSMSALLYSSTTTEDK